jgi:putative ABC transport system permease protein
MLGFSGGDTKYIKRDVTKDSIAAAYFSVSPSFSTIFGLQIIAGQNLPQKMSTSVPYVLINEEAARILHFKNPADATGNFIWENDSTQFLIYGVIKDFHFANFLRPIQPLVLANRSSDFKILHVKAVKGVEHDLMPALEKEWKKLYPSQPFEAEWFDKQLYDQNLHKDDLIFIGVLTIMALSIACLGLLGMVIYTTKNRQKEMAVRRVMGAQVRQLFITVSKEFITMLLIAVLIGLPIGILAGNRFLQQYAYQIHIDFQIIAGSAGILLLLGAFTIAWHTYRTALTNPARSLRTE